MKKIAHLILICFLIACSKDDSNVITSSNSKKQIEKPVAKNDAYTTAENTTLTITSLLDNDEEAGNVEITIDSNGIIGNLKEENGFYTYIPKSNFIGTDTFKYTICNKTKTTECATATVTITITDKGSPTANNDEITVIKNKQTTFNNLTANDNLLDGATITSINNSTTKGVVVLKENKEVVYTPVTDFVGGDSFTYTICDNDTPTPTCATARVNINIINSISFNIPTGLQNYYNEVIFTIDKVVLLDELKELVTTKHTNILFYSDRHNYIYDADEDPNNTANVLLMYTGQSRDEREWSSGLNTHTTQTFNTEHVYPQSLYAGGEGGETKDEIVKADLHHLRVCDASVNGNRSNRKFLDGTGTAGKVSSGWYPGDEWKGDVARMIFYLNVRYDESITKVGSLDTFLKWNQEDPVSAFEIQRNTVISKAQGNRNPFIDNPYLATLLWGGTTAENKWK